MIMPYFGKFPIWFELYLYGCSKNVNFDFYFITDCDVPSKIYSNTIFIRTSFCEYCELISKKLSISFSPRSPYKLCDVKPFYGVIHSDIIANYDYWGYGDIDVLYGDLNIILRKSRKYDVFSAHADRLSGHFTVVRARSFYSAACYEINNWRSRLEDEYVYGLDEHDFTEIVYPLQKFIWKMYRHLGKYLGFKWYTFFAMPNTFTNLFSRHSFVEYFTSILPKDGEIWKYDIRKSRILNPRGRELPYLHFLFFKKTQFYKAEHYWRENFWEVPTLDYELSDGEILFSNTRVWYENNKKGSNNCVVK